MPDYPGVTIEDIPPGPPRIRGVETGVAAFVGAAPAGPVGTPVRVAGMGDFARLFGARSAAHPLTVSVAQFFDNGGRAAVVVRAAGPGGAAETGAALGALPDAEFDLLVTPPLPGGAGLPAPLVAQAVALAEAKQALAILDPPPGWTSAAAALAGAASLPRTRNAALYFPAFLGPDPLSGGAVAAFAPSGAIAGVMARTDRERGVWKSPAGVDAFLNGATGLAIALGAAEHDALGARGINTLRIVRAGSGPVVWGARTLSDDAEWKYVAVRRTVAFLIRSLDAGTQWAVFEPNGPNLWAQVRRVTEDFLGGLWRSGALQGRKPEEAYFVRCGTDTMTQADLDQGRLIVLVGVALLRPAEFVIFRIGQWTADA